MSFVAWSRAPSAYATQAAHVVAMVEDFRARLRAQRLLRDGAQQLLRELLRDGASECWRGES